jgi:hypothetical protein
VRDTIIGDGAVIEDATLHDSLIGEHATVRRVSGSVNLGDHGEVVGSV